MSLRLELTHAPDLGFSELYRAGPFGDKPLDTVSPQLLGVVQRPSAVTISALESRTSPIVVALTPKLALTSIGPLEDWTAVEQRLLRTRSASLRLGQITVGRDNQKLLATVTAHSVIGTDGLG